MAVSSDDTWRRELGKLTLQRQKTVDFDLVSPEWNFISWRYVKLDVDPHNMFERTLIVLSLPLFDTHQLIALYSINTVRNH